MISIVSGSEVSSLDRKYIQDQGISSIQLMERAATAFCDWFKLEFPSLDNPIFVFCGQGNNGGDGLAISRILFGWGYSVSIVYIQDEIKCSQDFQRNFNKLPSAISCFLVENFDFNIPENGVIIDGIFGVGLNRPITGRIASLVEKLNGIKAIKIAIDIPSGLLADGYGSGVAFEADYTITFQFPKLALLFPENARWSGHLKIVDIGIPNDFLDQFGINKFFLQQNDIPPRHRYFNSFSHKGDFGRVLLIGGSFGKMGSILLSAKAALRTGSGLVFCCPPESESLIVQISCPELMVINPNTLKNPDEFDAIGIGPGWGVEIDLSFFKDLLANSTKPVVVDADGLNLISLHPDLLKYLPKGSILTPHLKEFDRLVGKSSDHLERIEKARAFSSIHQCIVVLKGAYTLISLPDGKQIFNSTGNEYMATAGSGDVLTGIITSFLGQGYSPENAAICGVYHHGLAGELASVSKRRGLIASDIIEKMPETFLYLNIR